MDGGGTIDMSESEQQLKEALQAIQTLLKWVGGSIFAGLVAATGVAISDHYTLRDLSSKVTELRADITPKVEHMWYLGGWGGSAPTGGGQGGSLPSPARSH